MKTPRSLEQQHRSDLAPALAELDSSDAHEQVKFWKSIVQQKQPELEAMGGLPLDGIANDVLTRYFDSSTEGIHTIFKCACRDQAVPSGHLDKDGLYDALSEHLSIYPVLTPEEKVITCRDGTNEAFEILCAKVGLPECPVEKSSFSYITRHVRKAVLLVHFGLGIDKTETTYHIDFDDDDIFTPFSKSMATHVVHRGHHTYNVPTVGTQLAISNYEEYLFTSKLRREGRVHWSHMHFPSTELLLAVGQVWRLPGSVLSMLCELRRAKAQISYLHPKRAEDSDNHGYSWSNMVLPAIFLDEASRQNLDVYRRWFHKMQDPHLKKGLDPTPPRIHVAVTHNTLCMMWSSLEANSLVTAETEGFYIGKWNTDTEESHAPSVLWTVMNKLTCAGCCHRRSSAQGEYQKLATDDPDERDVDHEAAGKSNKCEICGKVHLLAGLNISHSLHEALTTDCFSCEADHLAKDEDVSCVRFEQTFEKVLHSLESQNSMLRLGDHYNLLTRIALNRTADYLDVLEVYEAAIKRLNFLLQSAATTKKDDLIAKIETVKLELVRLEGIVKPFGDYVVPDLVEMAQHIRSDYPLAFHHVRDVQNNIREFLPKCSYLVSRCENNTNGYDRVQSDKMNNILNILTFITFVITPMQLMTGLYGMNFRVMPELQWEHGYHYFWCMSIMFSIMFTLILICLKRQV